MKFILKLFIFTHIVYISFSIVPLWNFEYSAINLFSDKNEHEYAISYDTIHDNFGYLLMKKIEKVNDKIEITNRLSFRYNSDYINQEVSFDEIESAYTDKNGRYFICPKGKHHVYYLYPKGNINMQELKPDNFNDTGDWELNCYLQYTQNVFKKLFVFYFNKEEYIYTMNDIESGKINPVGDTKFKILSFRWTTTGSNNVYPMYAIIANQTHVAIEELDFIISADTKVETTIKRIGNNTLLEIPKSNFNAFLSRDFHYNQFFYISYDINNTNISSGYNINIGEIKNYNKFSIINNIKSPFEFFDDVKIEYINFIPYTKYAYYKLYNNNKNKYYYGFIDIELNKVIYNTDEQIKIFKPYSSDSMLAITSSSAYQICAIYNIGHCINLCIFKIYYDINNYNNCSDSNLCTRYQLYPEEICIDYCDQNYFYLDENKYCGLCKNFGFNRPYKMINSQGCLDKKIENSIYVNEELLLISCKDNYTYNATTNQCEFNCYSACETCFEKSFNSSEQKCLTCKNSVPFLYKGNFLENCPNKTYNDNNTCFDCNESCLSCDKTGCIKCQEEFYTNKDTHTCEKCYDKCNDCSIGGNDTNNNCLNCKNDYYLIIGGELANNCLLNCPENTVKDDKENVCRYVDSYKSDSIINLLQWIFIIIIAIIFIIINILFFRRCISENKEEDNIENTKEFNDLSENNLGIN